MPEHTDVTTRYFTVPRWSKWTFEADTVREWVESNLRGRTLNACAGKTKLDHDDSIVRNDLDPDRDTEYHLDVAQLAAVFVESSFDTIVFDPPWNIYQANLRYDGRTVYKGGELGTKIDLGGLPFEIEGSEEKSQLGHARLAKEGFDHLLGPGGVVIEIGFHGTCMPGRMDFMKRERAIFDPYGEGKAAIGSIDQRKGGRVTL